MYERGVADAYRGIPHPFYYQNFEPYRQAYDRTRQRMLKKSTLPMLTLQRLALNGLFVIAVIGVVSAIWYFTTTTVITPQLPPSPPKILPTLAPSKRMALATATLIPPTAEPLILKKGGRALIQQTGQNPLRVRVSPSVDAKIIAYMHDDEVVEIIAGPILADGYVWWQIKGTASNGWSAESNNQGVIWIVPVP